MGNTKHEDAILKMAMDIFKGSVLPLFGIHETIVEATQTELNIFFSLLPS